MEQKVRVGVIGVGALGKEHARIYAELARSGVVQFVGVYDIDPAAASKVATQYGVRQCSSAEELLGAVDAVNIVTPTTTHYQLTRMALERGCHVLVEKPMTDDATKAMELVQLAKRNNCILQVGHIERYNPVFAYLESVARDPKFIEVHRLSPFPGRSTDIGVVLDLMIHDIDIVLAFVRAPVESVEAVGVSVLSNSEDIANARIRFKSGCVANLTASRVSPERMRKIRVFSGGDSPSYISLDYRAQAGYIYRLAKVEDRSSNVIKRIFASHDATVIMEYAGKRIVREPVPITNEEPLRLELREFIECITQRRVPRAGGETVLAALDLAFEITNQIRSQGTAIPI